MIAATSVTIPEIGRRNVPRGNGPSSFPSPSVSTISAEGRSSMSRRPRSDGGGGAGRVIARPPRSELEVDEGARCALHELHEPEGEQREQHAEHGAGDPPEPPEQLDVDPGLGRV